MGCKPSRTRPSKARTKASKAKALQFQELIKIWDDEEWQNSLYNVLQNQTEVEVDLFELMYKVLDQNLNMHIDWMGYNSFNFINSSYFKKFEIHPDDQIMLLQDSWSEMLILDHIHQRMHKNLPDETELPNGQKFDLLSLALLGVPSMAEKFLQISESLKQLCFDSAEYFCLKFIIYLNAGMAQNSRQQVHEGSEQVHELLLEYCQTCYPNIPEKYNQLLAQIPELRSIAQLGEDFLYLKHMQRNAPHQGTLLMAVLRGKMVMRYGGQPAMLPTSASLSDFCSTTRRKNTCCKEGIFLS